MSLCQSCGGIIGRDCFHPNDCADIAYRMEMSQRIGDGQFDDRDSRIADLEARVREVEGENAGQKASFNLRWEASQRGFKRWQAAGEGRELTWPDHADLVVFLLDSLAKAESDLAAARVTIGELVGGLKPVVKESKNKAGDFAHPSWNPEAHVELTLTIKEIRRAAALVARNQAQQ